MCDVSFDEMAVALSYISLGRSKAGKKTAGKDKNRELPADSTPAPPAAPVPDSAPAIPAAVQEAKKDDDDVSY